MAIRGTNLFNKDNVRGVDYIALSDRNGLAFLMEGTTIPTSGVFAQGALFVKSNGTGTVIYQNTGTTTSPVFTLISSGHTENVTTATIAATSTTDTYFVALMAGTVQSIVFSGVDALAASDTNYITWTVTNLGQAGAGSTALLATSPAGINSTKVTGGTAIAANTAYPFTLSSTGANLVVAANDRLRIRATATGTLANTVTYGVYNINIA